MRSSIPRPKQRLEYRRARSRTPFNQQRRKAFVVGSEQQRLGGSAMIFELEHGPRLTFLVPLTHDARHDAAHGHVRALNESFERCAVMGRQLPGFFEVLI